MPTVIDLITELTAGPDLHGAACVEHRGVFDDCVRTTGRGRIGFRAYERAVQVCAECPVLRDCRIWVLSLPLEERPFGVVAGLIRPAARTR
jgi:hypothetical protein